MSEGVLEGSKVEGDTVEREKSENSEIGFELERSESEGAETEGGKFVGAERDEIEGSELEEFVCERGSGGVEIETEVAEMTGLDADVEEDPDAVQEGVEEHKVEGAPGVVQQIAVGGSVKWWTRLAG